MSQDAATPYSRISTADTNLAVVKASTAVLLGWAVYNTNANARYLKLYNKTTNPAVATDTPTLRITIPGNASGAGTNIAAPPQGIGFTTGLAHAVTANASDTDATGISASEVLVNLFYQ